MNLPERDEESRKLAAAIIADPDPAAMLGFLVYGDEINEEAEALSDDE